MEDCKNCKHYKKGFCKKKGFNVSLNANWCSIYKERLIYKLKKYVNKN